MDCPRFTLPLLGLALAVAVPSGPADAQIWDEVEDAAEEAVEDETANQVERLLREAVRCAFHDLECIESAEEEDEPVVLTDEEGNVLTDDEGDPITDRSQLPPEKREAATPGSANANYDFEPGERTLFETDFSSDRVGDFPRSLSFQGGSMEVVEWQGGRALRAKTTSKFDVVLDEALPERFTLELEFYTPDFVNDLSVYAVDADGERVGEHAIQVSPYGDGVGIAADSREGISSLSSARGRLTSELTPIRVMADGSYVKVFAGTERMANIPNADLGRTSVLRFDFVDVRDEPAYLANVRIAAGGKDLYEALTTEGRVAVQDILFETNAATIDPSSAEVLGEIASILEENPDLELLVEGHTDDEGGFQHNMELSNERAAAVKAYLVEEHGVEAARLNTIGLGPTQPVASNDTEEGRAENRRVELVRTDDGAP